jgi:hypothetical protein
MYTKSGSNFLRIAQHAMNTNMPTRVKTPVVTAI